MSCQGILLALDSVRVPDVEQQPVFAVREDHSRRQVGVSSEGSWIRVGVEVRGLVVWCW